MNNRTFRTVCLTIILLSLVATILDGSRSYFTDKRETRERAALITLMAGGIPAVTARCLLEESDVTQVIPCSKASSPAPGRSL